MFLIHHSRFNIFYYFVPSKCHSKYTEMVKSVTDYLRRDNFWQKFKKRWKSNKAITYCQLVYTKFK